MGPRADLTGKKFNYLTVLKISGQKPGPQRYWDCLCDCGKTKVVATTMLKSGAIKHCGCLTLETKRKIAEKLNTNNSRHIDRTGHRYGKLVVIKKIEFKGKTTKWLCQCDCGKQKVIRANCLSNGGTQSCGCTNQYRWAATAVAENKVYGRLTVSKCLSLDKAKHRGGRWLCQCSCGKTKEVDGHLLINGHIQSCGCLRGTASSAKNGICKLTNSHLIDLTGQKMGRWTVIEKVKTKSTKNASWFCRCECGVERIVLGQALRRGMSKSCGCYAREVHSQAMGINSHNWSGVGEISGNYFNQIRLGAKKRKIEFHLTKEDLWNQFTKQGGVCPLSGRELTLPQFNRDFSSTASLDRIDSEKNYTVNNIQWIYKPLNAMKQDLDEKEFIRLCCEIADKYRNLNENPLNEDQ